MNIINKFDVTISYDSNLINDESYPMQEESMIIIKGKKVFAEIVSNDINERISNLIVKTLHLAPQIANILKNKICQLKCRIDPAELRICRTTKLQKNTNINHPFFYIPSYFKEVLIIGDKVEVHKSEEEIYKFLKEEKSDNQEVYNLSILIPFNIQPAEYNSYIETIRNRCQIEIQTYEAIPPRKHSTTILIGTWENIVRVKKIIVEWIEKQRNMQMSRWNDYDKFDKMILNQQIRFTYKSLKRYIIEKHVKYLKHWDLTSTVVLRDIKEEPLPSEKQKKADFDMAQGETESLKFFMKQVDNETAVNVLFACNDGEISKIMDKFSLKKREIVEKCFNLLADNMRDYNFSDQYSRYKDHFNHNSFHNNLKYENSNNKYSSNRTNFYDNNKRNSTGNFYTDRYTNSAIEINKPTYSGRFKNMFRDVSSSHNNDDNTQEVVNPVVIIDKPKTPSVEKGDQTYREDMPSFYSQSREKYERRSRHYMNSDEKHGYGGYKRTYPKMSYYRRSSSRRSESRSHYNRRRY